MDEAPPTLAMLQGIKFSAARYREYGRLRRDFLDLDNRIGNGEFDRDLAVLQLSPDPLGLSSWAVRWDQPTMELLQQPTGTDEFEWLNDTIVSKTGARLVETLTNDACFVDSLLFDRLPVYIEGRRTSTGRTRLARILTKLRQRSVDGLADGKKETISCNAVYGVVNVGGSHWVGYRIRRDSLVYVDSSCGDVPDTARRTLHFLQESFFKTTTPISMLYKVRGQVDGSTCGLHTIWALKILLGNYDREFDFAYLLLREPCHIMSHALRYVVRFHAQYETEWRSRRPPPGKREVDA
jgi:hypothetical protein